MTRKRELSNAEIEAAQNLKKIWNEKRKVLKISQEEMAFKCGWSGQSAFSQYLHSRIPLNTDAVLKIAKILEVHPTEIMPEIAALMPTSQKIEVKKVDKIQETAYGLTQEAIEFAKAWQELPPEQRSALEAFVYATQKPQQKVA
jgi:transcriptional regulator with XRE-family HTH domain